MITSLSRLQSFYHDFNAPLLLHALIKREFPGSIALLTSFGFNSGILLALIAKIDAATPVLFLDTGKHFPETLDYARTLTQKFNLQNVRWFTPDPNLLNRNDQNGELWSSQPNNCCWLRKVEPLNRALEEMGLLALITERTRHQTAKNGRLEKIELDENSIFHINPLVDWSQLDQHEAMATYDIPLHPLAALGYKSIDCVHCTLPAGTEKDEHSEEYSNSTPTKAADWSV